MTEGTHISPEAIAAAREITRRRLMHQDTGMSADFKTALAEVAVLDRYGLLPSVHDLNIERKKIAFLPQDKAGRTVRIVVRHQLPFRVYARFLDVDVFVFVLTNRSDSVDIQGWLPVEAVEESPIIWFTDDNGQRSDFAHEVLPPFLNPMPGFFDFEPPCPHFVNYGGIWDYNNEGWECCGCGRYVYDRRAHDAVVKLNAAYEAGRGNQASTTEERD